jgi:hypothetical protein
MAEVTEIGYLDVSEACFIETRFKVISERVEIRRAQNQQTAPYLRCFLCPETWKVDWQCICAIGAS